MNNLGSSWDEKLEEARREWEKSLKSHESVEELEWKRHPYFTNVNEDPQLSGVIKLPINDG